MGRFTQISRSGGLYASPDLTADRKPVAHSALIFHSVLDVARSALDVWRMSFRIICADHTGITVSDLGRSLDFWQNVFGFEISHSAHQSGEMAERITGVKGAELKLAVLKTPGGHKIELLQYLAPPDRKKYIDLRPCDVGHVHVALIVDDLDSVLQRVAASGWKAAGEPQTLTVGPNAGKRVVYVRDPDGTTIEFMQAPTHPVA